MYWEHTTSADWMIARQECITATELKSLRSATKKLTKAEKAGTKLCPAFAGLWEKKHAIVDPSELDTKSFGPMARGHIMEPYAIADYSKQTGETVYPWDDLVIINDGLGFSPDGLDIAQQCDGVKLDVKSGMLVDSYGKKLPMPTKMYEVKSYNPDAHGKNMAANKGGLDERFQIAVGMMVCPSIDEGVLIQYCPQAVHSMYVRTWTREELESEVEELQTIFDQWKTTCRVMNNINSEFRALHTEQEINDNFIKFNCANNTVV